MYILRTATNDTSRAYREESDNVYNAMRSEVRRRLSEQPLLALVILSAAMRNEWFPDNEIPGVIRAIVPQTL